MSADNLALWNSVRTPDPAATKAFNRSGGFKGTATNAVYLIQRATELWGPMGGQWGVTIVDDRVQQGAPMLSKDGAVMGHEVLHIIRIELRHPGGVVPGYGQTMLVGVNKYGPYTDEEAPKKSLTDALSKALSWLGFAADIHLGRWDDNKYVNAAKRGFDEAAEPASPAQEQQQPTSRPAPAPMAADKVADWLQSIAVAAVDELADVKASALAAATEVKDADAYRAFRAAANKRAAALEVPA